MKIFCAKKGSLKKKRKFKFEKKMNIKNTLKTKWF